MTKLELSKHSINLRHGDYARIDSYALQNNLKAAYVIRTVISRFVDTLDEIETDEEELSKITIPGVLAND